MFRRLLAGALLVVAAAPARAADADALLPAETESVLVVNVRQALDSELVKKHALGQLKQNLQGNDLQKLLQGLGIDPLTDVDQVTVGSWGKGPDDMVAVAVLRGKFDPEKLLAGARAEAAKGDAKVAVVEEGKHTLVQVPAGNQPKPFFFGAPDGKTIVGANDRKRAAALMGAAGKGTPAPALKKELVALVQKQDGKASAFACGVMEGKVSEVPGLSSIPGINQEKFQKGLEDLTTFALTVRLTDTVGVEVVMGMKDADAADAFANEIDSLIKTVKDILPLLAMNQQNLQPVATEVRKTLKSKVTGKDVLIELKVTGDAVAKAAGGS